MPKADRHLFTLGHSNHTLEHFAELLKQHAIDVLVDVRSAPRSKYVTHFDKESLQVELPGQGIKYLYLGRQLGGRPENEAFYDDQGRALYYQMAESDSFLAGIQRLESWLNRFRVAIMCSEEDPEVCHRHLLVGRVMASRNTGVSHIRGDGTLTPADYRPRPQQLNLFGESPLSFSYSASWPARSIVGDRMVP